MSPTLQLIVFSALIVLGAVLGAAVPLFRKPQGERITFLAFAAGVMLGAAFFHMLPEAFERGGIGVLTFTPLGFVLLFLLERYVFVHACEEPQDCAEHAQHGTALGMTAFFGMAVHTIFDGVALGSSVLEGIGATTFLAIVAHKIPSSLSLAAILQSEGRPRRTILLYSVIFGAMVPVGVAGYFLLESVTHLTSLAPRALAFSAGTFLYIAVSDLLPHINRHAGGKKLRNVVGLLVGLGLMWLLGALIHEG